MEIHKTINKTEYIQLWYIMVQNYHNYGCSKEHLQLYLLIASIYIQVVCEGSYIKDVHIEENPGTEF